jgi:hypothetical protein
MAASTPTLAQEHGPPKVAASLAFIPNSPFQHPGSIAEEVMDVQFQHARFEANIPIRVGEGGEIMNGVVYSYLGFGYSSLAVPTGSPDALHDLSYRLAITLPLTEQWRLVGSAQPGIASDLQNIDGDHWRLEGGLAAWRGFGRGSVVGFGGAYRYDFGKALLLPTFDLQYETESMRFDLQLPRSAAGYLRTDEQVEFGLAARVDGSVYRLGGAPDQGKEVRYSVVSAGPEGNVHLRHGITTRIAAGFAAARRFEIQSDPSATLRNMGFRAGFFARLGVEVSP